MTRKTRKQVKKGNVSDFVREVAHEAGLTDLQIDKVGNDDGVKAIIQRANPKLMIKFNPKPVKPEPKLEVEPVIMKQTFEVFVLAGCSSPASRAADEHRQMTTQLMTCGIGIRSVLHVTIEREMGVDGNNRRRSQITVKYLARETH